MQRWFFWAVMGALALDACEPGSDTDPSDTASESESSDTGSPPERSVDPVILISIDGFRWDYREKANTPGLDRMVRDGVTADLVPVFPSKTFPNHVSQATGRYVPGHGIVGNSFFDPETYDWFDMSRTESHWFLAEPIWITATNQDERAVTVFWPGSETEYDGVMQAHWLPYTGSMPNRDRVDQLLTWLDEDDSTVFGTLYFSDVDSAGHSYGPDSSQVSGAISRVDRELVYLFEQLANRGRLASTNIIVVSDHGMTELSRDRAVFLDDYTNIDDHYISDWGPYATIDPKSRPVAEVLAELQNIPHAECTDEASRPEHLYFTGSVRIPPILCVADQGWGITSRPYFDSTPTNLTGSTHGFDPQDQDMHGAFYAMGPAFKQGEGHVAFEAVDLYPLMAEILQLEPAPHDGKLERVQDMLRD